jgi:hypothetical protein
MSVSGRMFGIYSNIPDSDASSQRHFPAGAELLPVSYGPRDEELRHRLVGQLAFDATAAGGVCESPM